MDTTAAARKLKRGTKRACTSCEESFYDLGRDPVVCPMCLASRPLADIVKAETRHTDSYARPNPWGGRRASAPLPIVAPAPVATAAKSGDGEGDDEFTETEDDKLLETEDGDEIDDVDDLVEPDDSDDTDN